MDARRLCTHPSNGHGQPAHKYPWRFSPQLRRTPPRRSRHRRRNAGPGRRNRPCSPGSIEQRSASGLVFLTRCQPSLGLGGKHPAKRIHAISIVETRFHLRRGGWCGAPWAHTNHFPMGKSGRSKRFPEQPRHDLEVSFSTPPGSPRGLANDELSGEARWSLLINPLQG